MRRNNLTSRVLRETTRTQHEVSRLCKVSRTSIRRARDGKGEMGIDVRSRFEAIGIPLWAWEAPDDHPLASLVIRRANGEDVEIPEEIIDAYSDDFDEGPERKAYPDEPPLGASPLEQARYVLRCARWDQRYGAETATERSKARADEIRSLALVAKLEQLEELREARFVAEHPAFRRVSRAILAALQPYPEATQAVVDALGTLVRDDDEDRTVIDMSEAFARHDP